VLWIGLTIAQALPILEYRSYDLHGTLQEINLYIGYVGFLLLLLFLLNSVKRIRFVICVLIVIAVAQTFFGMANYYSGESPFGWRPNHWAAYRVTGTFINRNFYANYIVMCTGFVLMPLMFKQFGRHRTHDASANKLNRHSVDIICLGTSVFLFSGMLLSGSRGSIIAFAAGLAGTLMLSYFSSITRLRIGRLILIIALGVGFFGIELLRSRFANVFTDGFARLEQWKATTGLILEKALFGYGPGSYEVAYKSGIPITSSPLTHDHAHSDYLEVLLEQGLAGGFLLLVFMSIVLYFGIERLKKARSNNRVLILLSALFGMIAMLIHSMYDFPFQVPSNTVLFLTLVSILLAAEHLPFNSRNSIT
jgi:O-antigen ligase